MSSAKKVTVSSGNVFADLGFANPEEELLKAKLVREIRGIIKRRKLTQTKAAAVLGLKQPDVSALVTGRVGKFSIDRLVRCLDRLDYKVDFVVRQKAAAGFFAGDCGLKSSRGFQMTLICRNHAIRTRLTQTTTALARGASEGRVDTLHRAQVRNGVWEL